MTVHSRDTKGTTLAAVWKSSPVQRQTKCEHRAAPGLPQPKAQTQSCCPWKEARASPQFTPPTSQPCSHPLYLTTSNRCANPSLDLHHPSGRMKPHGFSRVRLEVLHTRTARWSQGLKGLPCPSRSKGTQSHLLGMRPHRAGTVRGEQRWAVLEGSCAPSAFHTHF